MKRISILLVTLAVLLCGCKQAEDPTLPSEPTVQESSTTTVVPSEEPIPEVITPVYTQQPMVAVSVPTITEITTADDGTAVCGYTYQTIHLVVQDQQIADAIIIDFLNRQDENHTAAADISVQAVSDYSSNSNWIPYFYKSVYSPMRVDNSVLSLFGQTAVYSGGNHAYQECLAANYNMITGDVLTLGSILQDVNALEPLCELVIQKMELLAEDAQLFSDYPDVVRHRFAREESYDEDWFFTGTGLNFYFAPYEVAPYVSGTITVEIPYDELTGIIADEFFPAEEDICEGTVIAQQLTDTDMQQFTQIAEVSIDPEGTFLFLSCDGLVRNVRIESGSWDESGSVFTPDVTVFATYTLSPGDGIMLQAQIPDSQPNLCLSYRSGEEMITKLISKSSDGTIILTDIE